MIVEHQFGPYYDQDSKILILGSFPSIQSRKEQFYYAHKQNRFWKVLGILYSEKIPETIDEKKDFLKRHHIALWDVIESCEIVNSDDSSISNVKPTDIHIILNKCKINKIYCLGNVAGKYFKKYHPELIKMMEELPSTSSANASFSLKKLIECYEKIKVV